MDITKEKGMRELTPSVKQQIVDKCPECDAGHLDLFQNAWSALESDTSKGIIDTSYEFVDCGSAVSGPLTIHLKSGVSQYWFSAQVVNANRRTAKLEVSIDDGKTWKAAKRTDYNFFEIPSGVGAAKASVRVTSGDGKSVVVKDVAMTPDLSVKGPSNYQ
jgi:expansin (peptidoglycan-binding protein)